MILAVYYNGDYSTYDGQNWQDYTHPLNYANPATYLVCGSYNGDWQTAILSSNTWTYYVFEQVITKYNLLGVCFNGDYLISNNLGQNWTYKDSKSYLNYFSDNLVIGVEYFLQPNFTWHYFNNNFRNNTVRGNFSGTFGIYSSYTYEFIPKLPEKRMAFLEVSMDLDNKLQFNINIIQDIPEFEFEVIKR